MKYNKGDRIELVHSSNPKLGVIDNIDYDDSNLPYHVIWDNGNYQWISEGSIQIYKPRRRFKVGDTVYSKVFGNGVVKYVESETYTGYLHYRVLFENDNIIWVSDYLEDVPEQRIISSTNETIKTQPQTEMKKDQISASELRTIIVEFEGSERKYTYNTSAEVKEGDKIRVPSQRGGSFVTITVVRVLNSLFKYVNRQTGDLLNEFTNSNCIDIKTLEIGQPKTDVVIGYKI